MVCQQIRKYHFKQSVSCISLLSVIVFGGYLLWAEWPAIKYHLDSTEILSFRNAGFLFLFIIIMLVVTVFSATVGVSGNHEIHSQIVIPGVIISVLLQCSAIMMMRAWLWPPYVIAGTFLIVQFWNGYLTGWVQRDLNEGRVKTGFWNIVSEFWLLIPLVLSGWGLSWGYYTTLFTS